MAGYAYVNPLAGLIPPHSRHAAYHVMAGYAYVNPLAGLKFLTPRVLRHPHGYDTPTPETGLEYYYPVTHPTMLWQVMLTSTP